MDGFILTKDVGLGLTTLALVFNFWIIVETSPKLKAKVVSKFSKVKEFFVSKFK